MQHSKQLDNLLDLLFSHIIPVINTTTRIIHCIDNICVNFCKDIYSACTVTNEIGDHDSSQIIKRQLKDMELYIKTKKIT